MSVLVPRPAQRPEKPVSRATVVSFCKEEPFRSEDLLIFERRVSPGCNPIKDDQSHARLQNNSCFKTPLT